MLAFWGEGRGGGEELGRVRDGENILLKKTCFQQKKPNQTKPLFIRSPEVWQVPGSMLPHLCPQGRRDLFFSLFFLLALSSNLSWVTATVLNMWQHPDEKSRTFLLLGFSFFFFSQKIKKRRRGKPNLFSYNTYILVAVFPPLTPSHLTHEKVKCFSESSFPSHWAGSGSSSRFLKLPNGATL